MEPHYEPMKPILLIAALAAALAANAQETPKTNETQPTPQTREAVPQPKAKKDRKAPACSDLPPDQQIRFRLPPAWEQEMARKRAEIERKTGIVLPPPPPPKVLPPCPPAQPKPAPVPAPANPSPEAKKQ